ncbi:hypothetical protein T439DRAFT_381735, partial [Meredithblackwellia eburnea MCA 4105]
LALAFLLPLSSLFSLVQISWTTCSRLKVAQILPFNLLHITPAQELITVLKPPAIRPCLHPPCNDISSPTRRYQTHPEHLRNTIPSRAAAPAWQWHPKLSPPPLQPKPRGAPHSPAKSPPLSVDSPVVVEARAPFATSFLSRSNPPRTSSKHSQGRRAPAKRGTKLPRTSNTGETGKRERWLPLGSLTRGKN